MEDVDIYAPQWIIGAVCKMNLQDIFNGMVRKPREYDLYPKKNYGDIRGVLGGKLCKTDF